MVSPMPGGNVNYPVTVTLTLNNQVLQSLINPTAKKKTDDSSSKVLKTLYSLEKFASASLRNSDVMKAYTGAMGKTFGAAMNLLLLPFMPLFNLLLLFMNKMIVWLVTSGVLDKMLQASQSIARGVERLFDLWENFSWSKLGSMIWDGIQEVMGNKVGFGALAVGGLALAHMMPFIGPLMMMAEGFLIKRGIGMIIGRGAAAAGAAAVAGGAEAGVAAAGAGAAEAGVATAGAGLAGGGLAAAGLAALAVLGGVTIGAGSQVLASNLIQGRTAGARLGRTLAAGAGWAAGGALTGAAIGSLFFGAGAVPGAGIGAAVGGGIGLLLQGVGEIKDYMQYGNDSGAQGDQGGQGSYYYKNNSDNTTTNVTNYISPNYSDLQRVMNGLNSSSSGVPLSGGGGGGAW